MNAYVSACWTGKLEVTVVGLVLELDEPPPPPQADKVAASIAASAIGESLIAVFFIVSIPFAVSRLGGLMARWFELLQCENADED
ncbi:hypothetical protein [Rugamonas apoptosis]|uniref:hypothetical protein n=1 Tax=Rugamonas apoptosis TaxID=2758570 RepID=UPI001E2C12C1|nr:hypothetical protein [Rugamonas apoptosis]